MTASPPGPPLVVRLAAGDITTVRASLVVVGHVNGLPPTGAERAVDAALGGALSRRAASGLLDAHFGASQFLPARRSALAADAVLVLALGEAGKLDRRRLPELGAAIIDAMGAMGTTDVATVVHGAGGVGVSTSEAARLFLTGLYAGVDVLPSRRDVQVITIVEHEERTGWVPSAAPSKRSRRPTGARCTSNPRRNGCRSAPARSRRRRGRRRRTCAWASRGPARGSRSP